MRKVFISHEDLWRLLGRVVVIIVNLVQLALLFIKMVFLFFIVCNRCHLISPVHKGHSLPIFLKVVKFLPTVGLKLCLLYRCTYLLILVIIRQEVFNIGFLSRLSKYLLENCFIVFVFILLHVFLGLNTLDFFLILLKLTLNIFLVLPHELLIVDIIYWRNSSANS